MSYPTLTPQERDAAAHLKIEFDETHAWLTDLPAMLGRVLVILADIEQRLSALENRRRQ